MKPEKENFVRRGRTLININTAEDKKYPSVNKAKKESRAIQMRNDGVLGRGSVEKWLK